MTRSGCGIIVVVCWVVVIVVICVVGVVVIHCVVIAEVVAARKKVVVGLFV